MKAGIPAEWDWREKVTNGYDAQASQALNQGGCGCWCLPLWLRPTYHRCVLYSFVCLMWCRLIVLVLYNWAFAAATSMGYRCNIKSQGRCDVVPSPQASLVPRSVAAPHCCHTLLTIPSPCPHHPRIPLSSNAGRPPCCIIPQSLLTLSYCA